MSESIFESFEAYLKEADYPKGKKKIMQAAVDLISTKGYNGTSTLQIAEHAGLSQATLFKYFQTKDELLTAILHPILPSLLGNFLDQLLKFQTTEEKIHYFVYDRMNYLKTNQTLLKIVLQEMFSNEKIKKEQEHIWSFIQGRIGDLLQELKTDPRINPDLTISQFLRILIGPLLAYFGQLYILGTDGPVTDEDLSLVEKQILGGLWK